jgi:hypothetical protein
MTDSDAVLVDLLRRTIECCADWFGHQTAPIGVDTWMELRDMTRR